MMSSYFPILTYSFFKYRLERKQEELTLLMERVNLLNAFNSNALKSRLESEYAEGDYILPVFFVTIIVFLGMFLLFMSWAIYMDGTYMSVLFSASDFWEKSTTYVTEKRSVSVVAYAIMGSFISGSRYIYRRFSTIDLTPGNFFSVGLRTIMAALISLMIAFLFTDPDVVPGNMLLVIAFLTGLFPDTGLRLLLQKVKIFPSKQKTGHVSFPLESIEGISEMHKIRLNEVGIDNVQNLAQFNFIMLIIKTPFPVRTLLDWTAQAKLILEFRDDYTKLQQAGIRSALDFLDACDGQADRFDKISETCGINRLSLEINYENLKNDQSVALLDHFRQNLEHFQVNEASANNQ